MSGPDVSEAVESPGSDRGSAATDRAEDAATAVDTGSGGAASDGSLGERASAVEALLLSTDRAVTAGRLAEWLCEDAGPGRVTTGGVHEAVTELNRQYEATGRSFRIEKLAGGYRVMTLPKFGALIGAATRSRRRDRLNPSSLETLAIIAYRQPIMRQEIESIRGVACGEVLRSLTDRKLIKVVGRAEEIGRPMLYGTTRSFLEAFGLSSLSDLPRVKELKPA